MNISTSLALALIMGNGGAAAQGVVPGPMPEAPKLAALETKHETGTVMAVDAATGKLRVKDHQGKISRFSAKKAKVHAIEGKIISLADISIGDKVSVSYRISVKGRDAIEILRQRRALKK